MFRKIFIQTLCLTMLLGISTAHAKKRQCEDENEKKKPASCTCTLRTEGGYNCASRAVASLSFLFFNLHRTGYNGSDLSNVIRDTVATFEGTPDQSESLLKSCREQIASLKESKICP